MISKSLVLPPLRPRLGLTFSLVVAFAFCAFVGSLRADLLSGRILCDANNDGTADPGDKGMAGVLVIVTTEVSGSSNAVVTASDGSYSMTIPNFDPLAYRRDPLSQSYVMKLSPDTLPADATVVFPQPALGTTPVYYIAPAYQSSPLVYISLGGQSTNGDWLISSASCRAAPVTTNACRLTGAGVIAGSGKHMENSFGGNISSKLNKHGLLQGNWKHDSRGLKLSFKSTAIDSVDCSQAAENGSATGTVANAIAFTGRGTLRSQAVKKAKPTPALFSAYVVDHGKGAAKDEYYLRVYTQDGTTLLLISGDPANPDNVAPVAITKGDLRVKTQ